MTEYRLVGDALYLRDLIPEISGFNRVQLSYWSSPEALAAHVAAINPASCWERVAWKAGFDFTGTDIMYQALDMVRKGWPEGAARVAALRDKIVAIAPVQRRYVRYDIAGAIPNVPRYLAGNPQHMRRIDNAVARQRPVITLLSDISALASVRSNSMENRAAVVAAIVDVIEAAGYATELVAFASASKPGTHVITAASVKASHNTVDLAKIAFALGHPAMLRRLCFATRTGDTFTRELTQSLGRSTELPIEGLSERKIYMIPSINSCEAKFADEGTASTAGLAHLISELAKQGCPAFASDQSTLAA